MGDHTHDADVRESTPNASGPQGASGDMGVSSERTGPTGPGQHATDGVRPVAPAERDPDAETPPEQSTGNPEENPAGLEPKPAHPEKYAPPSHG